MIDWDRAVTREQQESTAAQELRLIDKMRRQSLVDEITVRIDGMLFQGDELSQGRMLRRADTLVGGESAEWVLADNSVALVTADQLRAAAREAVDEMGRIWVGTR